ncbi:helix-turn-helix domain-containing protein [Microbacterium hominis]|uniref:helix-turn-helix domain-containing protein n=1 Tax=Microbacterium hominis TaxID=162426 RepID=UPI000AFAC951|nr:helix-turn-helix transcriptional regulator [Microbacterium hominis]
MTIVDSLRRARRRERLSLRTVADRSGIGITNLSAIENARRDPTTATAQRIADALGLTFVPVFVRGRTSAAATSDAVARAEAAGDDRLSYREFIQLADDLASVDGVTRVLLAAEEPVRTETRWDDAIAALVEFRLSEAGAPVPQWVIDRQGSADEPWEPRRAALPLPFPVDISAVAEPFLRRGVLIEKNELQSA